MSDYHKLDLPTEQQIKQIHERSAHNFKYRLIILLMQEAGLRVTEVIRLQIQDFDFENRIVSVKSLKKRKSGKKSLRHILLTENIIEAFAKYWPQLKDHSATAYLFPAGEGSSKPYLDRRSVWRRIKKYSGHAIHPHALRHFFAILRNMWFCAFTFRLGVLPGGGGRRPEGEKHHRFAQNLPLSSIAISSARETISKLLRNYWGMRAPKQRRFTCMFHSKSSARRSTGQSHPHG